MIHFPQCLYINLKNNHLGLIQINNNKKKYTASKWNIYLPGAPPFFSPAAEVVQQCELEPRLCTEELKGYSPKVHTFLPTPIYLCYRS